MATKQDRRKALIVGGGIGGLASALALQRAGYDVVVFERASEIREVGAGLALWSGTVALLRTLGVADEVIASGGRLERSRMFTWRGDLLIGADGLHSVIRAQLVGESAPRYAGYTCWRAIAPLNLPSVRGTLSESWGPGARFGLGDVGHGRVLWFATANAPEGEPEPRGERKQRLLARFGTWHEAVVAALEATPEAAILRNDIYDREPIQRWGEGRVTLLGDAAHPTTPNLGMGACMAIEDALVVGAKLQETADVAAGLRAYEDYRRDRTARITRLSRQFGWVAQWQNPLLCTLRDLAVKLTPAAVTRDQFRQVLTYRVLSSGKHLSPR